MNPDRTALHPRKFSMGLATCLLLSSCVSYEPAVLVPSITLSADCLLYTSPSPRDVEESRMPSSA